MLFKVEKYRNGQKMTYFFVGWVYENKTFVVPVKPCFNCDFKLFFASALILDSKKAIRSYLFSA